MSVWYCIPTKKPVAEAMAAISPWQYRGYKIALFRDAGDPPVPADLVIAGEYDGYAIAVNQLCQAVLKDDPEADWLVTGGDDMTPDPDAPPEVIAAECTEHFRGTFGVMQPTGDRQGGVINGLVASERICGSPWMGREFIQRWNGGAGPFWPGYFHFFCDEELHDVTQGAGLLWQRRDLTHHHDHWSWAGRQRPAYLEKARLDWDSAKLLFELRKVNGFPGHRPLPMVTA